MLSASSLFLLLCAVVRNGVLGAPARKDVGHLVYRSRSLVDPFVRISSGRVVILSESVALSQVSIAPMSRSRWITTTIPPGLQISL